MEKAVTTKTKATKLSFNMDLEIPRVPNFIMVVGRGDMKISVGELDEESLLEIAELWKQNLLVRAKELKDDRI